MGIFSKKDTKPVAKDQASTKAGDAPPKYNHVPTHTYSDALALNPGGSADADRARLREAAEKRQAKLAAERSAQAGAQGISEKKAGKAREGQGSGGSSRTPPPGSPRSPKRQYMPSPLAGA